MQQQYQSIPVIGEELAKTNPELHAARVGMAFFALKFSEKAYKARAVFVEVDDVRILERCKFQWDANNLDSLARWLQLDSEGLEVLRGVHDALPYEDKRKPIEKLR